MIGKHMAAAIQKTGDIIGETGQKLSLLEYERQEKEKERLRAEAELDQKLNAQIERERLVEEGRQSRFEQGIEAKNAQLEFSAETRAQLQSENIAAAKERTLARIRSSEEQGGLNRANRIEAAEKRAGADSFKPGEEARLIQSQIKAKIDYLGSNAAFAMKEEDKAKVNDEIATLQAKLDKVHGQFSNIDTPKPVDLGIDYKKGLVGQGMGAKRDKPAATGDNASTKPITREEYSALPSGARYLAPDGTWRTKQ